MIVGRTKSSLASPTVEASDVGVHVINPIPLMTINTVTLPFEYLNIPVTVWRVLPRVPLRRVWVLLVYPPLGLGLVIDTVKPDDPLQENMKLWGR